MVFMSPYRLARQVEDPASQEIPVSFVRIALPDQLSDRLFFGPTEDSVLKGLFKESKQFFYLMIHSRQPASRGNILE